MAKRASGIKGAVTVQSADAPLRRVWTKAVGTPGYDKQEWNDLRLLVSQGIGAVGDLDAVRTRVRELEEDLAAEKRTAGREELERLAAEERLAGERRAAATLRAQLAAERTRARTQLYLARLRTSDENLTLNALKQAALLGTAIKRIFEWVDKSNAVVLLACPACGAAWTQDRDEGVPASGWRLCPRCLRELPDSWEQGAAVVRAAAVARQYAGTAEYMEAIDTASDRRG